MVLAPVINLAGASIAGGRWTTAGKRRFATVACRRPALVRAITAMQQPSPIFISRTAVGYYGSRGDEPATETTPADRISSRTSVATGKPPRISLLGIASRAAAQRRHVLARHGGALPQMALPFKLFVGGPAGTGRQFMSWIHVHDWVGMVKWALATQDVAGPLNVTAPGPVTNEEFSRTLGRALSRPSWLRAPSFARVWFSARWRMRYYSAASACCRK